MKRTLGKIGVVESTIVSVVSGVVVVFTFEVVSVNGIVETEVRVIVFVRVIGIVLVLEPVEITVELTGHVVVVMTIVS